MSYVASNVSAGKPGVSGAIYRAIRTASLEVPSTVGASLSADYACLGYISEDGVTNSTALESNNTKAWGGDIVLSSQTGKTDTFKFKLLEVLNEEVLKAVHGNANVTVAAATTSAPKTVTVSANADEQAECVWVIDMVMRGNNPKRIVIPYGKITDIGDVNYKDSDAAGYEVTLTATPDATGNTHYEYMTIGTAAAE